ncbi:MAG TPA: hypothetical protein PKY82_07585 [Pyrinomonadaceae bacterium]|nr:hypothetical protein [Pyrinomonadaceae bacterium]
MFFVGYKPSTFYVNFSLIDLVRNSQSPSGLILSKNSNGGGGGGMGGGGISNNDFGSFNSTQDFSAHLQSFDLDNFNQLDLMKSLQNDLQKILADSGATTSLFLEINPPAFQVDYNYTDKILGYVSVSGGFLGDNNFRLKAKLHEISKNKEKPVIERINFIYKPTGNYYVVPFKEDNASAQDFWAKGRDATQKSIESFQKRLPREASEQRVAIENLKQAVVYTWRPLSAEISVQIRRELKEAMYEDYEVPEEYNQFGIVYFLNELALQMYQEIGEDFEVWKTIAAEEAAKIALHPSLQGYYIPKNQQ